MVKDVIRAVTLDFLLTTKKKWLMKCKLQTLERKLSYHLMVAKKGTVGEMNVGTRFGKAALRNLRKKVAKIINDDAFLGRK